MAHLLRQLTTSVHWAWAHDEGRGGERPDLERRPLLTAHSKAIAHRGRSAPYDGKQTTLGTIDIPAAGRTGKPIFDH